MQLDELGSVPEESLKHFIYLIGTVRGGTTVFRDALGLHPEVLAMPGLTNFMNQVWRYRKKVHHRLLKQIYRLPSFYDEKKVLNSLDEKRREALNRHLQTRMMKVDLARWYQNYALVWGLDPDNDKDPGKARAWLDKANDTYGLEDIVRAMPEARLVFITRDPRASILSIARRIRRKGLKSAEVLDPADLITASIHWRNMTQRMLAFRKRHPDKAAVFKFEDFIVKPEETLNRVFEFAGVSALPKEELAEMLSKIAYGSSNDRADQGQGISTRPLSRWKEALPPKQVAMIERLTGATALKAGYEIKAGRLVPLQALSMPGAKAKGLTMIKLAYLEAAERMI